MNNELTKRDANKKIKRELIIATAEKHFLQKDFERTSMDDVSKESGFTKRTIYQYFTSKEDLFFAVALKGIRQINSLCEEAMKEGRNGLEKIRLINKVYCQFYINNPEMFRLINSQPDNKLNCEASPCYRELRNLREITLKYYMGLFDTGKTDGSLNMNLNTKKAAYFEFCSSMGLLNMVSTMDKSYFWEKDHMNEQDFLLFSMDMLADALK